MDKLRKTRIQLSELILTLLYLFLEKLIDHNLETLLSFNKQKQVFVCTSTHI